LQQDEQLAHHLGSASAPPTVANPGSPRN